jgi:hypothetical protein
MSLKKRRCCLPKNSATCEKNPTGPWTGPCRSKCQRSLQKSLGSAFLRSALARRFKAYRTSLEPWSGTGDPRPPWPRKRRLRRRPQRPSMQNHSRRCRDAHFAHGGRKAGLRLSCAAPTGQTRWRWVKQKSGDCAKTQCLAWFFWRCARVRSCHIQQLFFGMV